MGSRPTVVIVGGGIGGLFAANALVAQGLRVSVYETALPKGRVKEKQVRAALAYLFKAEPDSSAENIEPQESRI